MIRRACVILSYLALAAVLAAPLLYFSDALDKRQMQAALAVATVAWFVCGGVARARALPRG